MEIKKLALVIAGLSLLALIGIVKGNKKASGMQILSLAYLCYWGCQYFLNN